MVNILIFIGIFISQLLLKAFGDWWYKKYKKRVINHGLSSGIDILIYIIAGYFFIITPMENISMEGYVKVLFALGLAIVVLDARWIFYDLIYNWINKEKWSHCGDSSFLDIKGDLIDGKDDNICTLLFCFKIIIMMIGISLMIIF